VGIFFDEVSAAFPSCYQSEVDEDGAHLCFRFDQNFANIGEGPVELRFSVPTGATPPLAPVFQRIYWSDDPAHFNDSPAGEVEFHVTHGHYHFKSFGLSRLWSVDTSGKRSGAQPVRQRKTGRTIPVTLVASGRKVSFCLADTRIDFWAEKGDGPRKYNAPDCLFPATSDGTSDTFVQGVNRGWGDTYDYYLPDQYIEVSGVPDGDYILDTLANPDHQLLEVTEANNCISVKVRLQGMTSPTPSAQLLGPGPACSSLQP